MEILNNVSDMAAFLIDLFVSNGDTAVDMTMGNGYDTKRLMEKVGKEGKVYSFDIQHEAIENTKKLIGTVPDNLRLIKDSHENIDLYVNENIDFAVYNLGYLPGGDKSNTTKAESSIKSLEKLLELMRKDSHVVICSYVGHEGGMEEYEKLLDFLGKTDKKKYNIVDINHINRRKTSPKVIIIEKIKQKESV